jgi:4-amino-4-deoxy-L-arabinose transferase-like glycosyltransferase
MFRSAALTLLLYTMIVLSSLSWTPLWLDEVQQLGNTRHSSVGELMRWVQVNAGASPLPYLLQRAVVDVLGYSAFAIRLPAALCSILSGVVFAALCFRFLDRGRWVGLVLFLVLPLQFRYGLEARVYSQGLLFALLSMWLYLRLRDRPSVGLAVLYGIAVTLGLYSQPLTIFVALAALAERRNLRYTVPAVGAAVLAFLPWYVLQREAQIQYALMVKPIAFFSIHQITPLVLLHDLSGGGYACTAAVLVLAVIGLRFGQKLLWYTLAVSFAGPILMDVIFNYFFAERQLLFAMPALILLAALGVQKSPRFLGCVLLGVFLISAAIKDIRQATVPKDELARTADAIAARLPSDACILTAPPEHVAFYSFLRPELEGRACGKDREHPEILAVTDSYTSSAERQSLVDSMSTHYEAVPMGQFMLYRQR